MDIRKLIEAREICEIYLDNSDSDFYLAQIVGADEVSIVVKLLSSEIAGEFDGYALLPRAHIAHITYGSNYAKENMCFSKTFMTENFTTKINCREEALREIASRNHIVSVESYAQNVVVTGYLDSWDKDSLTVSGIDGDGRADGKTIVNCTGFYILNWLQPEHDLFY